MAQVRSFPTMFLVIATAPLGVIGAVPALLLTGRPFGFTAMLGLIGLAGILMRNTLILVDQIRQNKLAGFDDRNAVIEDTVHRARPVLLPAVAAVLVSSEERRVGTECGHTLRSRRSPANKKKTQNRR